MNKLLLIILTCSTVSTVFTQTNGLDCIKRYNQAKVFYDIGKFNEALDILSPCIEGRVRLSKEDKRRLKESQSSARSEKKEVRISQMQAYELAAKTYLEMGERERAESITKKLFSLFPAYTPFESDYGYDKFLEKFVSIPYLSIDITGGFRTTNPFFSSPSTMLPGDESPYDPKTIWSPNTGVNILLIPTRSFQSDLLIGISGGVILSTSRYTYSANLISNLTNNSFNSLSRLSFSVKESWIEIPVGVSFWLYPQNQGSSFRFSAELSYDHLSSFQLRDITIQKPFVPYENIKERKIDITNATKSLGGRIKVSYLYAFQSVPFGIIAEATLATRQTPTDDSSFFSDKELTYKYNINRIGAAGSAQIGLQIGVFYEIFNYAKRNKRWAPF